MYRLTCVYASCKVEENHVSAEELGKGIQQDHQVILSYEMIVLQSIGFDRIVYAPYRSMEGFINDMEDFSQAKGDQLQMLKENWLPTLRNLVAQINETFSRNFQEMAVAGEVSLDEHDMDFDKFGILIKVKFRSTCFKHSFEGAEAHRESSNVVTRKNSFISSCGHCGDLKEDREGWE